MDGRPNVLEESVGGGGGGVLDWSCLFRALRAEGKVGADL